MAANYWSSTQRKYWFFDSDRLADMRDELTRQNTTTIEQYPYPDRRLIFIFVRDRLLQLSKRLAFRQQCVATAMIYLQRYFLFTPLQNVNIYLLVTAAFYLASKTEESPHHIRLVASEARSAWPEYISSDVSRLGEMEFCLISELHSQLIVWHPYRSLIQLRDTPSLSITSDEHNWAWSIVNDTYMTDLPFICEPHLLAITAMFLATVLHPNQNPVNAQSAAHANNTLGDRGPFATLAGHLNVATSFGYIAGNLAGGKNDSSTATGSSTEVESIGARTMAAALGSEKMQRIMKFIVDSEVDIARMLGIAQEIISLYKIWEQQYSEKAVKDVIAKCIKGRGLDG